MKTLAPKNRLVALAVLVIVAALGSTASAEVFKTSGTYSNNFTSNVNVFVPLQENGATSLPFNTPGPNKVIKITFNAECGSFGPVGTWTSVIILVDNVQARPNSGSSFALCTASVANTYTWVGATRQSLITVPAAGAHTVQVLATLNGNTTLWVSDISIVVEQK